VLVPLLFVVGTQEASFSSVNHVDVGGLLRSKGLLNTLYRLLRQALGEGDLENNVKISEIVGLLVEGQTLVLDSLDLLGFDDLTWVVFDSYFATVQMGQNEVHTSQCLVQGDFLFHQDVSTLALEGLVWLLLYDDDHVAWLSTWVLIGLTVEGVGLSVGCTLIDLNIDGLSFLLDALSIAFLALVLFVDLFTFAIAIVTWSSRLSVETWTNLLHFLNHAAASAA